MWHLSTQRAHSVQQRLITIIKLQCPRSDVQQRRMGVLEILGAAEQLH